MASASDLVEIERNIPSLRRYAVALVRDLDGADDLVQTCLERALPALAGRRGVGMRPWLFSRLNSLSVGRWHRRLRSAAPVLAAPELSAPSARPAGTELRAALRGLDLLSSDQRRVILLVAVEGFDYAETAAILAVPVATVMSRLSLARDRLSQVVVPRAHLRRVK